MVLIWLWFGLGFWGLGSVLVVAVVWSRFVIVLFVLLFSFLGFVHFCFLFGCVFGCGCGSGCGFDFRLSLFFVFLGLFLRCVFLGCERVGEGLVYIFVFLLCISFFLGVFCFLVIEGPEQSFFI